MKKLIFAAAILFCILSFKADAQLSISINIGSQPAWGPTGYNHVDYYYFPDIDCYYYVPTQQYIYLSGSSWIQSSSLPPRYSSFDVYNSYKVVVNSPKPYLHASVYRAKYASYKGKHGQAVIRDSHDTKYTSVKHPGDNRQPARPQPKPQPRPQSAKPSHGKPEPAKPQSRPQPAKASHGSQKPTKPEAGNSGHDNKKDDHH